MRKLFLIVPCFNEAEVLPLSIPRMLEVLDSLGPVAAGEIESGIIISDDGSTDGTAGVVSAYPDKRVQHLPLPHSGQQGAILGGIRAALEQGADAVITLDADLQDDPAAIPEMVSKWLGGKEVVYGVRDNRGNDSFFKRFSAQAWYFIMHLADKRHIPGHADFRLMGRRCAEALLEKASAGGDLIRNVVPTLGFDSAKVYYSRGDRTAGESKYSAGKMLSFGWRGIVAQAPFCLAMLLLFTFVAYFFTSIDSPVHDNMSAHGGYIRHDSAWYFMCGKAWVNGLVPYVDFADSKGPLLWLIYAVAYLFSPHSWAGLLWINALAYLATAFFLFKVCMILTGSPKKSMWMGMMLNALYFIPLFIFDDKAEVMTLPFVSLSMLMACKSLYGKEPGSFFWWGFSFGAIILIKYSVGAMTGIFLIAMLTRLRSWKAFLKASGAAMAGFAVIVVPMLLYFLWKGILGAFIQEYFITTFQTIDNIMDSNDKGEFFRSEMLGYMAFAVAGAITSIFVLKKARWFPPVALAWFLLCLSRYARSYYFIPVNVLMVFTVLVVIRCFDKDFGFRRYICGALIAVGAWYLVHTNAWTYEHDYFFGRKPTIHRERAGEYMQTVAREHNPRVLYFGCGDHGYGILAEDLPACKYWAIQAGCTKEMTDDQENAVKKGLADFVFINTYDKYRQDLLLESGYSLCDKPEYGDYRLFSKKN